MSKTGENKFKFGNLHLKNAEQVSDYTKTFIASTEEIITQTIPDKIFYLEKLDKEDFRSYKDISSVGVNVVISQEAIELSRNNQNHAASPNPIVKKRKLDNMEDGLTSIPSVPCNKKLLKLIDLIKPEIKDLIETCEKLKTWIQLLIPKIEDGNNFGVSIQEEVLNEVHRIEGDSINYLDGISRYFITRGKIISKLAKYPYLDDYRRAIQEVDEKEYLTLLFSVNDIKSHYLLILDVVSKNYEKIKKPRSQSNLDSMY